MLMVCILVVRILVVRILVVCILERPGYEPALVTS
jgi:hypothetical protein